MKPTRFVVVGSGWRAEYFFRIAAAQPNRFEIQAVIVRRQAEVERLWSEYGLAAVTDSKRIDDLDPDFVVVATSPETNSEVCEDLVDRGHAVLLETPAGVDHDQLDRMARLAANGAPVQVAEQYRFQPLLAARLAVIASGRLGPITSAHVSVAHGYHGVALIRAALGVGIGDVEVRTHRHHSSITRGPDRSGPPVSNDLVASTQTISLLSFGGQLGIYDWCDDQYFSWIRSLRFMVRGERGELVGHQVRYLLDSGEPVEQSLRRWDTGTEGNLETPGHRGYLLGDEWVYRNPFPDDRLSDDEIAVASVLDRMRVFVATGAGFYSLQDSVHDSRLALRIDVSANSNPAPDPAPR